jgi:hypothetical protein
LILTATTRVLLTADDKRQLREFAELAWERVQNFRGGRDSAAS